MKNKGFTLIELMLVMAIVGVLVAVIVPRAWRANVDSKYGMVRQTCAQLAGYANDWAERQLETQPVGLPHVLNDYMATLAVTADPWIAAAGGANNWANNTRDIGTAPDNRTPTAVVSDLVPQGTPLRNPFNGLEVFRAGNANSVPGAIACAQATDTPYTYYALIFQSTAGDWYAGQGTTLAGLRNGIFIARLR